MLYPLGKLSLISSFKAVTEYPVIQTPSIFGLHAVSELTQYKLNIGYAFPLEGWNHGSSGRALD
jgi:hypothetical protein